MNAVHDPRDPAAGTGFVTLDGDRWDRIADVDRMDPFLASVVSDSDVWLFVGSNGAFTAGRQTPDVALLPYETADRILDGAGTGGVRTSFLVSHGGGQVTWEPWHDEAPDRRTIRSMAKRLDGTAVRFEEVHPDLGLRFAWDLEVCQRFGVVRHAVLEAIGPEPVRVRLLDGWRRLLPPGLGQETWQRYSYLATAYMRHERVPGVPLALFTLNAPVSDRPEPAEALRTAAAWCIGHRSPTILLSERQVEAFRRGGPVSADGEVRGEVGAFLVADAVELAPGERHAWITVADTALDHAAVADLLALLRDPDRAAAAIAASIASDRDRLRRRIAAADGTQVTADEAATANHQANVLNNVMRGGSPEDAYTIAVRDVIAYLGALDRDLLAHQRAWLEGLPDPIGLQELLDRTIAHGDPSLARLIRRYLPLSFSRRHGDPSRPWNRFSIRLRDAAGDPVLGYEGNWRDIFQNWEALATSYPGYLPAFIATFLDASTADGYNPYRITRGGIDWEVDDPRDPWSHLGYWGDHQLIYLLRLLEAAEAHQPGGLAAELGERYLGAMDVPYRIAGWAAIAADPTRTITFDRARHEDLVGERRRLGGDAAALRDAEGRVRLFTLAEKLLVPLLVKLTNLVPGSGIWLDTQRPEWNDANNALAGWGVSLVTLAAARRYARFLEGILDGIGGVELSSPVAALLRGLVPEIEGIRLPVGDETRFATMERLGRLGEAHRRAVYAGELDRSEVVDGREVRALLRAVSRLAEATLRAAVRSDGLFHGYERLQLEAGRASVAPLGLMLEGQVAVLESGILDPAEAVALLRALRASDLFRPDQRSYLLYPDRPLTSFPERNTFAGEPPTQDPHLFTRDRDGRWHFQADLTTARDLALRLEAMGAGEDLSRSVTELWRTTFDHAGYTGRSTRFFAFEGLGSIYWHMVAKLLLAVARIHADTPPGLLADELAGHYHAIRDGLGFRRSSESYGAFRTDPYSHTPRHRGAQQPGMTGQVKEQVLARFAELGVGVVDGRLRIMPRLLLADELLPAASTLRLPVADGMDRIIDVPAGGLAFTWCGLPIVLRTGPVARIELERSDGGTIEVPGSELDRTLTASIVRRDGSIRRATAWVVAAGLFHGAKG
jgi:hypothetical protein